MIGCLATGQRVLGAQEAIQRTPVPSRDLDSNWGRAWRCKRMDKSQMKAMGEEGPELWEMQGGQSLQPSRAQRPRWWLWTLALEQWGTHW